MSNFEVSMRTYAETDDRLWRVSGAANVISPSTPKVVQISAADAKNLYLLYSDGTVGYKEFGKPVKFVGTTYPEHEA